MALTVRVTGQAEFSQIRRELKGLNQDFGSLKKLTQQGTIGGLFTNTQAKTFQYLQREMKNTVKALDALLDEENLKIEQLNRRMQTAARSRRQEIEQEIQKRRTIIQSIQDEINAIENKTDAYKQQAQQLKVVRDVEKSSGGGGLLGGGLGFLKGIGGKALGLAGIAGIGSMLAQGVQGAAERQKAISLLGMRIGGANPNFEYLRKSIRDTGLRNGYTALESMAGVEAYTSKGGGMTRGDQLAIQQFARSKGLDLSQVATTFGSMRQIGASNKGEQKEFANLIANAIDQGNMQERSVEAMESTAGLLGDLAQVLPEVSAKGTIALQTLLNQTGVAGFMGERGADIISKINSMFTSGDKATEFFTLRALGWGTNKNYYGAKLQAEQGVSNPGNLAAIMQDLQKFSSPELQDMALSRLTGMSLTQAKTLREKTNGYKDISEANIKSIQSSLSAGGTIERQSDVWGSSTGGWLTKVDASLEEALAKFGNGMLNDFYRMKSLTAGMVNDLANALGSDNSTGAGAGGGSWLPSGTSLAVAGGAIGGALLPKLFKRIFRGGAPAAEGIAGLGGETGAASSAAARGGSSWASRFFGATKGWGNAFTSKFPKMGNAVRGWFTAADEATAAMGGASKLVKGGGRILGGAGLVIGEGIGLGMAVNDANKTGEPAQRAMMRYTGKNLVQNMLTYGFPGIFSETLKDKLSEASGNLYGSMYDLTNKWVNSWFSKDKTKEAVEATVEAQDDMQQRVENMSKYMTDDMQILKKEGVDSFKALKDIMDASKAGAGVGYGGTVNGVPYAELINRAGGTLGVDPALLAAVISAESSFNPKAVSKAGAAGLMQLMPGTAAGLGVTDSFDPESNVFGGTKYLRDRIQEWGGDVALGLAAYNAGSGRVRSAIKSKSQLDTAAGYSPKATYGWSDIKGLMPEETQGYVDKIMKNWGGRMALIPTATPSLGTTRSEMVVTIKGDGLNGKTLEAIKEVARQVFNEMKQSNALKNPSVTVR